jgi:hypothetical protein
MLDEKGTNLVSKQSKPRVCPRCKKDWRYTPGYCINSPICWLCMTPQEREDGEKTITDVGKVFVYKAPEEGSDD